MGRLQLRMRGHVISGAFDANHGSPTSRSLHPRFPNRHSRGRRETSCAHLSVCVSVRAIDHRRMRKGPRTVVRPQERWLRFSTSLGLIGVEWLGIEDGNITLFVDAGQLFRVDDHGRVGELEGFEARGGAGVSHLVSLGLLWLQVQRADLLRVLRRDDESEVVELNFQGGGALTGSMMMRARSKIAALSARRYSRQSVGRDLATKLCVKL